MATICFIGERSFQAMCVGGKSSMMVNGSFLEAMSGMTCLSRYPNVYWISEICYILNYSKVCCKEIITGQNVPSLPVYIACLSSYFSSNLILIYLLLPLFLPRCEMFFVYFFICIY